MNLNYDIVKPVNEIIVSAANCSKDCQHFSCFAQRSVYYCSKVGKNYFQSSVAESKMLASFIDGCRSEHARAAAQVCTGSTIVHIACIVILLFRFSGDDERSVL